MKKTAQHLIFNLGLLIFWCVTPLAAQPADTSFQFSWKYPRQQWFFLNYPSALAVEASGTMLVGDKTRLIRYDAQGEFQGEVITGIPEEQGNVYSGISGVALDRNGFIYISDATNDCVHKYSAGGVYMKSFGGPGSGSGEFMNPMGLAVNPSGNLLNVVDIGNGRVQRFTLDGVWMDAFKIEGENPENFGGLVNIAFDKDSKIYLAVTAHFSVHKYEPDGTFIKMWGGYGSEDDQFSGPRGIAVGPDNFVYVSDSSDPGGGGNRCVKKFDTDGNFILKWGERGAGAGEFSHPTHVAVDRAGFLYVADAFRVQKFDGVGNFLAQWAEYGNMEDGYFNQGQPQYVTVDVPNGYIYAVGSMGDRIMQFDLDGKYIKSFGCICADPAQIQLGHVSDLAVDSKGFGYVVNAFYHWVQKFDKEGNLVATLGGSISPLDTGIFNRPTGIAIDRDDFIYIIEGQGRIQKFDPAFNLVQTWVLGSDIFNPGSDIAVDREGFIYYFGPDNFAPNEVVKMNSNGEVVLRWGTEGTGPGEFQWLTQIETDNRGFIYVTDMYNNRVQKFDNQGQLKEIVGVEGWQDGQLRMPYDISFDNQGCMVVADSGNSRLQQFCQPVTFIRGDANDDSQVNISDAIYILEYLFRSGRSPLVWNAADVNDDEALDIADAIFLLMFLFTDRVNELPAPFPQPGVDPA